MKRVITGWVPKGETLKETADLTVFALLNLPPMEYRKDEAIELHGRAIKRRRITITVEDAGR